MFISFLVTVRGLTSRFVSMGLPSFRIEHSGLDKLYMSYWFQGMSIAMSTGYWWVPESSICYMSWDSLPIPWKWLMNVSQTTLPLKNLSGNNQNIKIRQTGVFLNWQIFLDICFPNPCLASKKIKSPGCPFFFGKFSHPKSGRTIEGCFSGAGLHHGSLDLLSFERPRRIGGAGGSAGALGIWGQWKTHVPLFNGLVGDGNSY